MFGLTSIKEKAMGVAIVLLVIAAVVLGLFYENEKVDRETAEIKNRKLDADLMRASIINATQEHAIKQHEIDAKANQEEFDKKMAEKPKFKTQYRYVYSADINSSDVNATECKALMDLVDSYKASSDKK